MVAAIEAAKKASLRNQFRLRSFRNVVLIATLLASTLALLAVALVGIFAPDTLPLCYSNPGSNATICPASGSPRPADLLLIEFSGVLGPRSPRSSRCARCRAAPTRTASPWRSRC